MRRVALVMCGGTITSVAAGSDDFADYGQLGRKLQEPQELLALVPEAADVAELAPIRFRAANSLTLGAREWLQLAALLDSLLRGPRPPDGVVVTHGSATLEQTAYFLSLALEASRPVVVTAALRPHGVLGSDAALNLVDAVRVAASDAAQGAGVVVLANRELHAPREVTKDGGYAADAFRSPNTGPLGYVDPHGNVRLYAKPTRLPGPGRTFPLGRIERLPPVGIAYSHADADDTVIAALVDSGVDGLVSAGQGAGSVTPVEHQALVDAHKRGVLVVQASQAGRGRVVATERRTRDGLIAADNLNPLKARVLLMLSLTATRDPAEVQSLFDRC